MSKTSYFQRGESLDFVNGTAKTIYFGDVVTIADRVAVAGEDIAPGEVGAVHVSGVYEFPKTATGEIPMGKTVYFDGTGITDTAKNGDTPYPLAGFAAASAAAADTLVKVKLG